MDCDWLIVGTGEFFIPGWGRRVARDERECSLACFFLQCSCKEE